MVCVFSRGTKDNLYLVRILRRLMSSVSDSPWQLHFSSFLCVLLLFSPFLHSRLLTHEEMFGFSSLLMSFGNGQRAGEWFIIFPFFPPRLVWHSIHSGLDDDIEERLLVCDRPATLRGKVEKELEQRRSLFLNDGISAPVPVLCRYRWAKIGINLAWLGGCMKDSARY